MITRNARVEKNRIDARRRLSQLICEVCWRKIAPFRFASGWRRGEKTSVEDRASFFRVISFGKIFQKACDRFSLMNRFYTDSIKKKFVVG